MPTNRKRVRRVSQVNPRILEYMLLGHGRKLFGYSYDADWEETRDELLGNWIAERPCSRPFYWWRTDSLGPRLRVGNAPGRREENPKIKFGLPDCWWIEVDPARPPQYESEAAYLKRHGLLTQAEKKWLAENPEALTPVVVEYRIAVNRHVCPIYHEPPRWIK